MAEEKALRGHIGSPFGQWPLHGLMYKAYDQYCVRGEPDLVNPALVERVRPGTERNVVDAAGRSRKVRTITVHFASGRTEEYLDPREDVSGAKRA